jgi:spore maturation protein CgeB
MRLAMFYHSLVSDWNNGNAHFLRGIVQELLDRDVDVRVFEPLNGWSRTHLLLDHGPEALVAFARAYPRLRSELYDPAHLDLDDALDQSDVVMVHEWNDRDLVAAIGSHHACHGRYRLLFHDTHHRSVTRPEEMAGYDLRYYDGVLAFGDAVRDAYLSRGWINDAWTWHEAADTRVFHPRIASGSNATTHSETGDVVWIGNWGDEERTAELDEFLVQPSRVLGLRAVVYGVRYPTDARERLSAAGISYQGWLPNAAVPDVFARFRVTLHIPRRPYLETLPGVPTIRVFEALACGIPLVCARWHETGGLFTPGDDFLVARDGREMTVHLRRLLGDSDLRRRLAARGLAAVAARHTCAHRVDELMTICQAIGTEAAVT